MKNEIQIFQNVEFGAIRTMSNEQGEPMFCAKDVAEALGYKLARKAVQDHVDGDDVLKWNVIDSLGRKQLTFSSTNPASIPQSFLPNWKVPNVSSIG